MIYIPELYRVYNQILVELFKDETIQESGYLGMIHSDFVYFNEQLLLNADKVYLLCNSYIYKNYMFLSKHAFLPGEILMQTEKSTLVDFYSSIYDLNINFIKDLMNECLQYADKYRYKRIELVLQSMISAFSPKNNIFVNTPIFEEFYKSDGQNLLKGMYNLLTDLKENGSLFRISVLNKKSFLIGKTIANTEGVVVFENDYMQLLYYKPLQKLNRTTPVLIVPPWINRFYIFDLDEKQSMVKWLLEKGYPVFIVSWVNPGKEMYNTGVEEYMLNGPYKAMEVIREITYAPQVHIVGYCVSSTLVTMLLSVLQQKGEDFVKSATLLAAAIDFGEISDISAFLDEDGVNIIESVIQRQGYITGEQLNMFFSALRASDMIWRTIANYLTGKKPQPMTVLYWNSDSVRVPGKLHKFFLRELYLKNSLTKSGSIKIMNLPICIDKINVPVYCVGTLDDYIVPWKSAFSGYNLIGSHNKRFVLTASGHVLGIMNHPDKNKYFYFHNGNEGSSDEWVNSAKRSTGSWWVDWAEWLNSLSEESYCEHNYENIKAIEQAPGRYVTAY